MKKSILILVSILLASCSAPDDSDNQFCGNVVWAEYNPATNTSNVTLNNGNESKVIKVSPPRQYTKGEYICL